jgi:hypothetical protein
LADLIVELITDIICHFLGIPTREEEKNAKRRG